MKSLSNALIFSENFITSTTLYNILKKLGVHQVFESNSSRNALSLLLKNNFDFVFIDADLKGYELTKVVQQMHAFTEAELIVIGLPENQKEVLEQISGIFGDLSFLTKPIISDDVEEIIVKPYTLHFYGELI